MHTIDSWQCIELCLHSEYKCVKSAFSVVMCVSLPLTYALLKCCHSPRKHKAGERVR